LFQSRKLRAGRHVTHHQWTATRKRNGESQDQWTPSQHHGPDVTGWLSTVRPNEPIHRVDGPPIRTGRHRTRAGSRCRPSDPVKRARSGSAGWRRRL
jgi:hypothetical protein